MKTYVIAFLIFGISNTIKSQNICQVHELGAPGSHIGSCSAGEIGDRIGQSFLACETGLLTKISLNTSNLARFHEAGTYNLRIGSSSNPTNSLLSGAVYQTITTAGGALALEIDLTNPFPVEANSYYAFEFESVTGSDFVSICTFNRSDYSDGDFYFGNPSFSLVGIDLDFQLEIQVSDKVPTLGEWQLIILCLFLCIIGVVATLKSRNKLIQV